MKNKHHLKCPLEQNVFKIPLILSITPILTIKRGEAAMWISVAETARYRA